MTVSFRNGRLTPDQVQSISFPPARFGRRGLDEETVHSFCDQVQHELVTLLNEKASLWEEVERLRRRIIDAGDPTGARPEDPHAGRPDPVERPADGGQVRGRCAGV